MQGEFNRAQTAFKRAQHLGAKSHEISKALQDLETYVLSILMKLLKSLQIIHNIYLIVISISPPKFEPTDSPLKL